MEISAFLVVALVTNVGVSQMKRVISVIAATVLPGSAIADPGHIIVAAGHDHWVAGAALGAAVAVAGLAWLKGRREDKAETGEAADGEEAEA